MAKPSVHRYRLLAGERHGPTAGNRHHLPPLPHAARNSRLRDTVWVALRALWVGAGVAGVVELASIPPDDNLSIPLLAGTAMFYLGV